MSKVNEEIEEEYVQPQTPVKDEKGDYVQPVPQSAVQQAMAETVKEGHEELESHPIPEKTPTSTGASTVMERAVHPIGKNAEKTIAGTDSPNAYEVAEDKEC